VRELLRNLPAYRAASVAYVVTPAAHPLSRRPTFTLAFRNPSTRIYRLAGATPYFTSAPACAVRTTRVGTCGCARLLGVSYKRGPRGPVGWV